MDGFLLSSPELDVFSQMALDEALAQSKPEAFCIRFFRWKGVGVTFGYAQRIREVEKVLPAGTEQAYTRRPTGGGLVSHFDDVTFSCVFPDGGVLRPLDIYRRLHTAILSGLREAGLEVKLCETASLPIPGEPRGGQCFIQPVELDILTEAGKILGGAIRRYGNTVLYQGSLQLPDARSRAAELEATILRCLALEWNLQWKPSESSAAVQAAAAELESKYRSSEWRRKL